MKYRNLFLTMGLLFVPHVVFGACSTANLTRCLDSVCAINIGANPAARCQYCGSATFGESKTEGVMKNITAGSAAKYTISDKELKKAPKDQGQRYIWATEQCLKKVKDCTQENVDEIYDPLIEQSCKSAGISFDVKNLAQNATQTKTKSACSTEITACVIAENHCMANYGNCELDADFDKHFSECALVASGCDEFSKDIRSTLASARNTAFKNAESALEGIVLAHQEARETKLNQVQAACTDQYAKQKCVSDVCENYMPNKCSPMTLAINLGSEDQDKYKIERALAEEFCLYHDIACSRLPPTFKLPIQLNPNIDLVKQAKRK